MRAIRIALLAFLALAAGAGPAAAPRQAVAGLDEGFGEEGWVRLDDLGGNGRSTAAAGLARDGRGRLLIAGVGQRSGTVDAGASPGMLFCRDAAGKPDPSFGESGRALLESVGDRIEESVPADLVAGPDGSVLVCGAARLAGEEADRIAVWKVRPDGSPDRSFGKRGVYVGGRKRKGAASQASGILLRDDGSLLVTGSIAPGGDREGRWAGRQMVLWSVSSRGKLEWTFGVTGDERDRGAVVDWAASEGRAVIEGPRDAAYVTGWVSREGRDRFAAVWKVSADGQKEDIFWVQRPSIGNSVAVDAEGRVLVGGSVRALADRHVVSVWRFLPSGKIDPSFGRRGVVGLSPEGTGLDGWVRAMRLDDEGRVLVTGRWGVAGEGLASMIVWRILPEGKMDPDFGRGGSFTFPARRFGGRSASGEGLVLLEDGGVLVAGSTWSADEKTRPAIWKLQPD